MTIPSAFGAKGIGDKLTSGDANTLNADIQMALDKRAGQTDALASIVSCGGAGRIVDSYAVGANADTTYLLSGANSIIDASGVLTVDRNYTISNTGAISGDRCMVLFNSANCVLNVKNGSGTLLIVLGAYVSGAAAFASVGESSWVDLVFNGTSWQVWRSAKPAVLTPTTYTANGTWTCPRGVTLALLIGWGGGGGGGGGAAATTATARAASGGGGGGSGLPATVLVAVSAGVGYGVSIGAAGAAGPSGTVGTTGGATSFGSIALFYSGAGGAAGVASVSLSTSEPYAPGGIAPASGGGQSPQPPTNALVQNMTTIVTSGAGGAGIWSVSTLEAQYLGAGGGVSGGGTGGAGGNQPAAAGSFNSGGGGGGGGGGNGYLNSGAIGGAGGAASNGGTGSAGVAGAAAVSSSGGGGGGGGGGGHGTVAGGAGSAGGAGGAGQLTVIPIR